MQQMRSDERTLASWSFIKDYAAHRTELLELAKYVHTEVCSLLQVKLQPNDCERVYVAVLLISSTFNSIIQRKLYISSDLEETFATMLARYVLNKDWNSINSPCPQVDIINSSQDRLESGVAAGSTTQVVDRVE